MCAREVRLKVRGDHVQLPLGGLDTNEIVALMASAAGGNVDNAGYSLARAVKAHTEGNPLFVGAVLSHLAETGVINPSENDWASADAIN